jgi:hypothetical protein
LNDFKEFVRQAMVDSGLKGNAFTGLTQGLPGVSCGGVWHSWTGCGELQNSFLSPAWSEPFQASRINASVSIEP